MKAAIVIVHIVSAVLLAVLFHGGPPMGESGLHPWDVLVPMFSFVALLLCPLAYVCIWMTKSKPTVYGWLAVALFSASSTVTLAGIILWIQFPYVLYISMWEGCLDVFGKNA